MKEARTCLTLNNNIHIVNNNILIYNKDLLIWLNNMLLKGEIKPSDFLTLNLSIFYIHFNLRTQIGLCYTLTFVAHTSFRLLLNQ